MRWCNSGAQPAYRPVRRCLSRAPGVARGMVACGSVDRARDACACDWQLLRGSLSQWLAESGFDTAFDPNGDDSLLRLLLETPVALAQQVRWAFGELDPENALWYRDRGERFDASEDSRVALRDALRRTEVSSSYWALPRPGSTRRRAKRSGACHPRASTRPDGSSSALSASPRRCKDSRRSHGFATHTCRRQRSSIRSRRSDFVRRSGKCRRLSRILLPSQSYARRSTRILPIAPRENGHRLLLLSVLRDRSGLLRRSVSARQPTPRQVIFGCSHRRVRASLHDAPGGEP